MIPTAVRAVNLGIVRIAPPGAPFPGRNGSAAVPVLVDVRGALSEVPLRGLVVEGLEALLREAFPDGEVIAGVAKAGIAWASLLAWRAGLPAVVVNLDGPRPSGLQRQVEGSVAGRRAVLVDNLIGSGRSLEAAAAVVAAAGGEVIGALTVVADPGADLSFPVRSLWTLRVLIDASFSVGRIDGETHRRLTNPENTHEDHQA